MTLFPNFQITVGLEKSNGCVALVNLLHIDLQQWNATIYVNELILTLFSLVIVYRKTDGLEVDCYVALFLKRC